MKLPLLLTVLALSLYMNAQEPQTYTTFGGETLTMYKYEGAKTMLLAKDNTLDTVIMRKWLNAMDGAYNFYTLCTGQEPYHLPSTYINQKSTIASADPTCGAGCGYLGATGIELLDVYFDLCFTSILFENKYEQITFYEFGRNFWFYGNKLSYLHDPITTGYAVFMRFMSMKYIGVDDHPSHVEFVNSIRKLRTDYLADPSLNWSNTLGIAQGVPGSPWGAADLFASFCFYLEETYGWQWLQNVWKYAALRPDRVTTQDAVDNFIIASSQAVNTNLVPLFQEWRWPVSPSAVAYIQSLKLGGPTFFLDYNNVTVKCIHCAPGDTGRVKGVLYEAVDRDLLLKRKGEGADLSKVCTSPVTDMNSIFNNATSFNGDISSWDVSKVNNMRSMFEGASAFNKNIGLWHVGNVTDMAAMFRSASQFNQDIGSWNVGKVTNMSGMFLAASAFDQPLGNWDVSSVTNMSYMFNEMKFNQTIGNWDVSNVRDMSGMFFNAFLFNQDIGSWDVSNVSKMDGMFYKATVFNQDLKKWCVSNIPAEPTSFSSNSALTEGNKPIWGKCPQTYVPDDYFEQALIDLGYDSGPLDNYIITSKIKYVTTLNVSQKNIADLTGIEDFTQLTRLECYGNKITKLDLAQNKGLRYIDCIDNQLTSLNVTQNSALSILNCQINHLTNLDVSNNTFLTNLLCSDNYLTSLDISKNVNLTGLLCAKNKLSSLDVTSNTKLRELQCHFNQIADLDISKNGYINYLNFWGNKIANIDLSHQGKFLVWLHCAENLLSSLDISKNISLKDLYCWDNLLTNLDISQNKSLAYLRCENNQLTFNSLEPAIGIGLFTYSPQDSVGTARVISKKAGESYSFKLEVGGEHNLYEWYKDDVLLPAQNSATLSLTNLDLDDAGVYRCEVTNSVVTGLRLYSRKIRLSVDKATLAADDISDHIKVYPNPANDVLFVESRIPGEVMIFSFSGKKVLTQSMVPSRNEIDVSSLISGVYLLRFETDGTSKTIPFVKK